MFALSRNVGYLSHLIKQQKNVSEIMLRSKSTCLSCLSQQGLLANSKTFQYQAIRNKS